MFKKFKEKVMDSQTSQKFQQITQNVSDKFQNMDRDENFFSLTEDDNAIGSPTSTPIEPGFSNISLTPGLQDISRQRRTSISSMTSDTSFLPRYDSVSSIYHLQSDLEVSASEMEDNASTSSQIGHLSKEQIYAAFQKSQMRYHKYRGRFTDLANHYKKLEREFTKLKNELEITQERSFRRVRELKEQCELEQKAKAHLESSLRVDLDEKQIQINTLKDKITLLQNSSNSSVDIDQLSKNLNDSKVENENLNSTNNEMKAKLIVLQTKENEYKEKMKKLSEDLEKLKENERENNLKLAQSKMEIHNELLSKEAELNSLQKENDSLKKSLDAYETKGSNNSKIEHLQSQNANLIEIIENLTMKCNTLQNTSLKAEQYKIEIQNCKTKLAEEKQAHDQELIAITKESEQLKEKLFKEKQDKEDIIHGLEQLMFKNKESYENEIASLKQQIDEFETIKKQYENEIANIREEAKQGLISLSDLMKKSSEEKEEKIKIEFDEKLESLNTQQDNAKNLQIKILKYEDELKILKENSEKLEEKTQKYNDLESVYLQLKDDYNEERNKYSKLESEIKILQENQAEMSKSQAEISLLQQEIAKLHDLCKEQKQNIEKLLTEKEEMEKKIEILEDEEREHIDSKIRNLEIERNTKMHELDALKEEFEKLSEYSSLDKKKIEEYKLKFIEYQAIIEENKKKEAKLSGDYETYLHEKSNWEQILQEVNEKLESSKAELLNKQNEIVAHDEKSKILQSEKQDLLQSCDELKQKLENTELKLKNECDESKTLATSFNNIKEKYDELSERQREIVDTNSDLEKKLLEIQDTLSKTEDSLRSKDEELKELQVITNDLKNNSSDNELKSLVEKLKEDVEKSDKLLVEKSSTITELKSELDVKVQYIKNLIENYNILEKNEKDLKKEIEKYKIETDLKSKDLVILEDNFADFKKVYSTEKNDIMKQLNVLKQIEKNYYSLLDENENLKEQISEIALLQNKLKSLSNTEEEKKNAEESLKKLKEDFRILQEENVSSKEKLNDYAKLNEINARIEEEKNNLCNEISRLKTLFEENEKTENQLRSSFNELNSKHEALENSTKIEREKLNTEYKNLQSKYENLLKLHEEIKIKYEESANGVEKLRKEKYKEMFSVKEKILEINENCHDFAKTYTKFRTELLSDFKTANDNLGKLKDENEFLKEKNKQISSDYKHVSEENNTLLNEIIELKLNIESYSKTKVELEEKEITLNKEKEELIQNLEKSTRELESLHKENKELREMKISSVNNDVELLDAQQSYYEMKTRYDQLDTENKTLKNQIEEIGKTIDKFKEEQRKYENIVNELERHQNELLNEKQLLKEEIEELKISPINLTSAKNSYANKMNNIDSRHENGLGYQNNPEIDEMVEKLTQLKSLDITNKATIEFYENEVQKLKNNNEKLHRRLDETLVTLNHCAELSHSTELEYLKNVLYNYMLGKEGMVLAKVIATVCKFDDEQTEEILKKEHQKQTLLAKLGLL